MFVKIKDNYLNRDHISIASLRPDYTLVVDFAYSKENGEPVFLAIPFDTKEAAQKALSSLVGYDVDYVDAEIE